MVEERLWGAVHVVRSAVPKMQQGSITFTSGQMASRPQPGWAFGAGLLAGLETFAKGLALELAPIRVNCLAPGLIDTPLLGEKQREGAASWATSNLLVKRVGFAEEVAQAAVFLMTNGFMTGEVLHIDGGGRLI